MTELARYLAAATPSPSPSAFNPDDVTPGWIGFAVFFVIALITVLLVLDFVRRMRRVRYRDQIAAKLDREEAERREGGTTASGANASRPEPTERRNRPNDGR